MRNISNGAHLLRRHVLHHKAAERRLSPLSTRTPGAAEAMAVHAQHGCKHPPPRPQQVFRLPEAFSARGLLPTAASAEPPGPAP